MVTLRIFVSSPGDVGEERRLTARVIERLSFEWQGRVLLEPYFWEHEPLRATAHFQAQIPRPAESDVVLCVLWSRLGTRLPPDVTREDGSRYASGTEFEFEDAYSAHQRLGTPDLLVYRRTSKAITELDSEERVLERLEQKRALDAFVDRWFKHAEGHLTAALHTFEHPAEFEKQLERHLRRLIDERWQAAGGGEEAVPGALWQAGSPFRGLQAFEREHAAVFCGRTAEVSEVLAALRRQDAAGRPFVLVAGMSGCGKSSLVRAGVLPELTAPGVIEGIGLWRIASLVPGRAGADLVGGLAQALLEEEALGELRRAGTASGGTTAGELAELLRERPGAAVPLIRSGLAAAAQRVQRAENLPAAPEARLVLLVDQLEELFTNERISAEDRRRFDAALAVLVRSGAVWAIATVRSDFYSRCIELEEMMSLKEGAGQYDLKPPSGAALGHMIRQPARIAGLRFEETREARLDDLLVDEAVRDPESLPLLEFTLDELYRRRRGDGVLTLAAYRDLGGVEGALAHRAEEVFLGLSPAAQGALPAVLPALVTVDPEEGAGFTRRRSPRAEVTATPPACELVDAFVEHRLLVTDRADDGTPVVSIAHEALLRRWPRAHRWLEDNRRLLEDCARLKMAAALWRQSGGDAGFLLPEGHLLAAGRGLLAGGGVSLSEPEVALVQASDAALAAERRRRRRWIAAGVAAALAVAVGALGYLYLFRIPHVRYFEAFVRRHGVPEGVLEIDRGDAARRQWSLRFERRGRLGPVVRIEAVDAAGRLTPSHGVGRLVAGMQSIEVDSTDLASRECRWCFDYDGRGRLLRETATSCVGGGAESSRSAAPKRETEEDGCPGAVVYRFVYKPGLDDADQALAEFVGEGVATPQAVSGAALVEFTRTPEGWDRKTRYLDVRGQPAADAEGSYGQMVEQFTEDGLPLAAVNLGPDGFAALHRDGYVRAEARYDEKGRVGWVRFTDQQGRPTLTTLGFASAEADYDRYGNMTELRLLDPDGQPMAPVARIAMSYDRHGDLVRTTLFQADGKRARVREGWSAAVQESTRREEPPGRNVTLSFLDADDRPMTPAGGFARLVREYDEAGNLVAVAHLDTDGRPVVDSAGIARVELRYRRGKLAERTWLGADGLPVVPTDAGYATIRFGYDARQRRVQEDYFGSGGEPVPDASGVRRRRFVFDEDGHEVAIVYEDGVGGRMRSWRGEAEVRTEYDDERGLIVEQYLDVDHRNVAVPWFELSDGRYEVPEGCAARGVREEYGNVVEAICLDLDQEPVRIDGCPRIVFRYDSLGREIERACLDGDDRPIPFDAGFGVVRHAYDARGNMVGLSFFASADPGQPAPVFGNVTGLRRSYDELGNQVAETYVDEAGRPTNHPNGYARVEIDYDPWGRWVERRYLGSDGSLLRTAEGYARQRARYGPRGEMLELELLNEHGGAAANGAGYARATYAYDERGQTTEVHYFDAANRPVPRGTASVKMVYRDDGTRLDTRLDAAGRELGTEWAQRSDPEPSPNSPPGPAYERLRPEPGRKSAPPAPPTSPDPTPGGTATPVGGGREASAGSEDRRTTPTPPPAPASGDLDAAIERLSTVTESIVESYEEFLDATDREPEGREETIEDRLSELHDAAWALRNAYRGATGESQGAGRKWLDRARGLSDADKAARLRERAAEVLRHGDALEPLMAAYPVGERAEGQWREIRSLLAKVRAELL